MEIYKNEKLVRSYCSCNIHNANRPSAYSYFNGKDKMYYPPLLTYGLSHKCVALALIVGFNRCNCITLLYYLAVGRISASHSL